MTEFGKKYGYEFEHDEHVQTHVCERCYVRRIFCREREKWTATGAPDSNISSFQDYVLWGTGDDYKEQRSVTKGVIWLGDSPEMDNSWWHVGRTAALCRVIQGGKNAYRVCSDGFKAHSIAGTRLAVEGVIKG